MLSVVICLANLVAGLCFSLDYFQDPLLDIHHVERLDRFLFARGRETLSCSLDRHYTRVVIEHLETLCFLQIVFIDLQLDDLVCVAMVLDKDDFLFVASDLDSSHHLR